MRIFLNLRRRSLCAAQLLWVALPLNLLAAPMADLSLADASRLALENNPQLQGFQWRLKALQARGQSAALKPAYELGLEVENVLGSDEFSGTDAAEWTVSLASVVELGDQRNARVRVANSRLALAEAEREAHALDLLGMVTQTFITALTLQEKRQLAQEAVGLAQTSLRLVDQRVNKGAAPEAERLRAQAALTQAQLRERAVTAELASRKLALASLWGADAGAFETLSGDLYQFAPAADFESLYQGLGQSPFLQVFADDARLRQAELAHARSRSATDVHWSLGVRRFEESGAAALTAGVSVPLFASRRNRGDVQAALAEGREVEFNREAALMALKSRLFEAWQTYQYSAAAARQMRTEVLPNLALALKQTHRAYEQGRYNYADWVAAQRELLDAKLALIDAASNALLNQALIEQLTGMPLAHAQPLQGETP